MREVHESIVRKKDIVLMREVAEMHGGGELALVLNEIEHYKAIWAKLDEAHGDKAGVIDLQKALFNEDRGDVLLWHRVLEFACRSTRAPARRSKASCGTCCRAC